ncbi:MAG: hypothetical protein ACK56I_12055, partial [bacterium]
FLLHYFMMTFAKLLIIFLSFSMLLASEHEDKTKRLATLEQNSTLAKILLVIMHDKTFLTMNQRRQLQILVNALKELHKIFEENGLLV